MEEIVIDTRELPSPEPLERVLHALPKVTASSYLKMIHRMEPALLFPILHNNGYAYRMQKDADNIVIYIYLSGDVSMQTYLEGL